MKTIISIVAATLLVLPTISSAASSKTPPPIKALEKQGFKIAGQFDAPGGLTGYAANYKGRAIAIYLTPDHQNAIVGTMIDSQGRNRSAKPLQRLVRSQKSQKNQNPWPRLKQSNWVADGSADAPRVIYMFTDPNCPYCHKFWQAARPWVKAGKVQIRHVIVGILKPSSMPKAAAILSASDPSAALTKDERNYNQGGIAPMDTPPSDVARKVNANNALMKSLGLRATPAIYYHDADGQVQVIQGVPQGKTKRAVMGGPKP
ncbi:thiol:disulfide interchange protein DsbG [Salinisphaera orenii]|uniref:thiol:disulfide interchange protein DsbG n=1 Tax=Salinisphaera orenii TaxID=856731 RepID=UPI000DBE06CD